ncbi:MAG: thiol-disulfide oxidoreductase DCC family protein [Pseudoalteromonas prydzensis]|uniref:thiol-disulfide oxidoreductase DCC family protein n=1 Tax=Pseudoalteromonas prydzensis TaxID=182141 RepID=UPI003F98C37B
MYYYGYAIYLLLVSALMHSFNVPQLIKNNKIILFDGQCRLCSAWCNFIIKHDSKLQFKLCSVQSLKGQAILEHFSYPTDSFKTMIYVANSQCITQSDGVINVVSQLGGPWRFVKILRIIPKGVRDWAYDRIAFNRYRLFGQYNYCVLPSDEYDQHYL